MLVIFFFLCQVKACIGKQTVVGTVRRVGMLWQGLKQKQFCLTGNRFGDRPGDWGQSRSHKSAFGPWRPLLPIPSSGTEA